ncbi:MAG: hypothetical protein OYL92_10595 [Acidobacteriota bacterium]|nr:hypothetical protein [Acidobacteriota bacterium]MDE3265405.1 hypothetical protein [Acidobacteriota bacterium]
MHPYSRSLDVARLQCDVRRAARFRKIVRARARWGDPLLAGLLLALAVWAVVEIRTAEPTGGMFTLVESAPAPERRGE